MAINRCMAGWVLSCSDRLANDATMPDRWNTFSGDSFPKSAFVNRFSIIPFGKEIYVSWIYVLVSGIYATNNWRIHVNWGCLCALGPRPIGPRDLRYGDLQSGDLWPALETGFSCTFHPHFWTPPSQCESHHQKLQVKWTNICTRRIFKFTKMPKLLIGPNSS